MSPSRTGQKSCPKFRSWSCVPSMMFDGNQRRSAVVDRQDLEQHMHHRRIGLVEDCVIDVARLEKEVARSINYRLRRQDIGHITGRHLSDAGPHMIVLTDMTARSKRQFGDAKLVLAVDFGEEAAQRR